MKWRSLPAFIVVFTWAQLALSQTSIFENGPATSSIAVNTGQQGTLHVVSLGNGQVKSHQNDRDVNLGTLCRIKAKPDKGYIFSGWSGDIQSADPSLSFRLTNSSMNVAASFVPNPFPAVKGKYEGPVEVLPPIPGRSPLWNSMRVQMLNNGSFALKLRISGHEYNHSGKFAADGTATVAFFQNRKNAFEVFLWMDFDTASITAIFGGLPPRVPGISISYADKVTK